MDVTLNMKKPKIIDVEDKIGLYYRMQGDYKTLNYQSAWTKLWAEVKAQKLFIPYDAPKVTEDNKHGMIRG